LSTAALTWRQIRFTNKAFWRNPASAFFTFAFPLLFLVIFTTLLGNSDTTLPSGATVKNSTFYVPAMAAFGVISACYTNIAISVTFARDDGILKRTRGTPLPGWVYLLGRVLHATFVAAILVVLCGAFGALVYQAQLPNGSDLLQFLVTFLVGSASFAAMGLALTAVIPNADASPAIVNASILPILFLSGIFIPLGKDPPTWVEFVGNVFPVKHFAESMQSAFLGGALSPFRWSDVLVAGLWGVIGLAVAARFFSWEPRR
jgi:ABC-2 type transport system permease protein